MKKTVLKIVSVLLVITALVFTAVSCKKDADIIEYNELGIHYKLPKEFERITVMYSANCYYDGNAYFFFNAYTGEQLVELDDSYTADISVKDFTTHLLVLNDISFNDYTYDEAEDRALVKYVKAYDDGSGDVDLCYHIIFRAYDMLYLVNMYAPEQMRDTYEPIFDAIAESVHAH